MGFDCTKPQRPQWHPPQLSDALIFGLLGALVAVIVVLMIGERVGDYRWAVELLLVVAGVSQFASMTYLHQRNNRYRQQEEAYERWYGEQSAQLDGRLEVLDERHATDPRLTAEPRWIPYSGGEDDNPH